MADMIKDIKKLLKENKLVIGADETLKGMKVGKFAKVFLATNCSDRAREDVARYASLSGVEIVETQMSNIDLGDVCKKPFAISVMGLLK
jgi:large subunit ribosomal protein L30e